MVSVYHGIRGIMVFDVTWRPMLVAFVLVLGGRGSDSGSTDAVQVRRLKMRKWPGTREFRQRLQNR